MCLFSGQSYEEVARLLTQGLQSARRWRTAWTVPSTAAIWRARSRLGVAPLRSLFGRVCRPVATPDTPGAFYRRWRLIALDDHVRPAGHGIQRGGVRSPTAVRARRGERRLPADPHGLRWSSAAPTWSSTRRSGRCGWARSPWPATCWRDRLSPGMLLLADRGFHSSDLWKAASANGADLLWRIRKDLVLKVVAAAARRVLPQRDLLPTRPPPRQGWPPGPGDRVHPRRPRLRSTDSSPRSLTPGQDWPTNLPPSTPSGGSSSPLWTKSKPTRGDRISSCVHNTPTAPSRNSTASSSCITRSAP